MVKVRILILLSTVLMVGAIAAVAILYARGFRLEQKEDTVTLSAKGLLVINSEPNGAQVFVEDKLTTATNNTIPLDPGEHHLTIKKDGFLPWQKDVVIEKETVTQVNAYLLPAAPSLTALSFSGVINPQVSNDFTKIVYGVAKDAQDPEKGGLWLYETTNLPLGFSRDAKRITDADLDNFTWEWSPDSREILVSTKSAAYLLPASSFTTSKNLSNVQSQVAKIKSDWAQESAKKIEAEMAKIEPSIRKTLMDHATSIAFAPDETKILYTASSSGTLQTGLVKALPGSSTQKESRTLEKGKTYIYDVKEDKNFLVEANGSNVYWIPNSLNVIIPEKDKISVADYDGTNRMTVYAGNYVFPYAFATTSTSKMVILTNFGAGGTLPNLYWLSLK